MANKVRERQSADDTNDRDRPGETRIVLPSPKSEPNLESAFIFPKVDDGEPDLQTQTGDGKYTVIFGAVPPHK